MDITLTRPYFVVEYALSHLEPQVKSTPSYKLGSFFRDSVSTTRCTSNGT